jgi:S-methylmethionine-dependent homocysteine/selenocysteine methylase
LGAVETNGSSGDVRIRATTLFRTAVTLAREAAAATTVDAPESGAIVAASMGPYGAHRADWSEFSGIYLDQVSPDAIRAHHRARLEALVAARAAPDVVVFETVPALEEAKMIAEVWAEVASSVHDHPLLPLRAAALLFQVRSDPDRDGALVTARGELLDDAFAHLAAHHHEVFRVIGANCFDSSLTARVAACAHKHAHTTQSVLVKPNMQDSSTPRATAAQLALAAAKSGTTFIGFCCGGTERDVADASAAIGNHSQDETVDHDDVRKEGERR